MASTKQNSRRRQKMSNKKPQKHYVFIVLNDDGSLAAGRQIDIDNVIKAAENSNQDIEFKVIGRIVEPRGPNTLQMDFNENNIEWFEEQTDPAFIKRAVAAIANFL